MPFLGIYINPLTKKEIIKTLLEFSKGPPLKTAFYLNAHCVNVACSDIEYRAILNKSDLVYAGGQAVVWASRFLGTAVPERVNILDFFDEMAEELIASRTIIYLLGGTKETVAKAAAVLRKKGLNIAGHSDGFFDEAREKEVIEDINKLKPDILIVGMGVPKQEKWIFKHRDELKVNLCWAVGGAFKLLCGDLKRAPKWMIKCGLEWFFLGLQEPRRLLARYLIGNPLFIYCIFRHKLKGKTF